MSIVFDEKGEVVGQKAEDVEVPKVRVIICPDCGTIITAPTDLITNKVKARECPRCKRYLGEW